MNNGEVKYLFLDLDGTLLNTKYGIVTAVQHALACVQIQINNLDELERHIGPPLKEGFIEYYGFDDEKANEVVGEFRRFYKMSGKEGTVPYDGIKECLQKLRELGFHLIVATSKPEVIAKDFLKEYDMDQYFEDICGSTLDGSRSSKADVIRYILKKHQEIKKDTAVMIGDRSHDVIGAHEVDIPCIGVSYGFGSQEELLGAGAIKVVSSPKELYEYFLLLQ